jgi:hypothetical protein
MLDRRDFLKRTAASATVATLPLESRMLTVSGAENTVRATSSMRLNLVFHGGFAFVIWPKHIEVLAPNVDEHVYKAGPWKREKRLVEGLTYRLQGVAADFAPTDPKQSVVVSGFRSIDRGRDKIFCSMILPRTPIRGLRFTSEGNFFEGKSAHLVRARRIPLIQVLSYALTAPSEFLFGPQPSWKWNTLTSGNALVANLHLWAEPDVEAFSKSNHLGHLVELFDDLDLRFSKAAYTEEVKIQTPTPIKDVPPYETADLIERPIISETDFSNDSHYPINCIGIVVDNSM